MGCTAAKTQTQFLNGKPTFQGDEVVKGFEKGNGLLFRITKKKKKQETWAFYNDTKQYEMHVRVTFHPGCDIKPLGNAKLEEEGEKGEVVVTVTVAPGATEMFIEGHVNGFRSKMDAFKVGGCDGAAPAVTV
ncbi:small myristoylated protein-1 [Lotmaria passim]